MVALWAAEAAVVHFNLTPTSRRPRRSSSSKSHTMGKLQERYEDEETVDATDSTYRVNADHEQQIYGHSTEDEVIRALTTAQRSASPTRAPPQAAKRALRKRASKDSLALLAAPGGSTSERQSVANAGQTTLPRRPSGNILGGPASDAEVIEGSPSRRSGDLLESPKQVKMQKRGPIRKKGDMTQGLGDSATAGPTLFKQTLTKPIAIETIDFDTHVKLQHPDTKKWEQPDWSDMDTLDDTLKAHLLAWFEYLRPKNSDEFKP